jgi:hypothetical protein
MPPFYTLIVALINQFLADVENPLFQEAFLGGLTYGLARGSQAGKFFVVCCVIYHATIVYRRQYGGGSPKKSPKKPPRGTPD